MGQEYSAKSFRSGNSVAIRIPALLHVEPGTDWVVTEQAGGLFLRRKDAAPQRIDVSGFAGKAPGIRLAPRKDFDERPSVIAAREATGPA